MAELTTAESSATISGVTGAIHRIRKISATFLLVMLALLTRLVFLLIAHGVPFVESQGPYSALFQNETTNIAATIANGFGYKNPFVSTLAGDPGFGPTAWVAPVYPYFCAGVFRLFGVFSRQAFFFIVLLQCVLSALTCIPMIRVGDMTVGRRAAIVAAMIWALFPWFSQWANTYIWEMTLSALLFSWLFWFALRLKESQTWPLWIGFGALWGFALLVNPALAPLLPVSLLWLFCQQSYKTHAMIQKSVVAMFVCIVVITPWLVRNRFAFGQWVFIRSNFAFEFWLSNYHGGTGRDWLGRHPIGNPREFAAYLHQGELQYVRDKSAMAKQFVLEHPGEFLVLTAKRIPMFWDGSTIKYNFPAAPYWLPWSFPLFSVLMIPSLALASIRHVHGWSLFLGAILLYPLPYYIVYSQARYRHVLEPLMLLLIAHAGVRLFDRMRHDDRTPSKFPAP